MSARDAARRIVYVVADWPGSGTTGGQIRQLALARAMETVGPVTLLAINHVDTSVDWSRASARFCRRRSLSRRVADFALGHLTGRGPVLYRAERAGLAEAFLSDLAPGDPPIVVLGKPLYGRFLTHASAAGCPVVIDADESLARSSRSVARSRYLSVSRRVRAALDCWSFSRLEARDYRRADQVWVASEVEATIIGRLARGVPVRVIPNSLPFQVDVRSRVQPVNAVAFVGSYLHPPNEAAALELIREVMPAVRRRGGPQRAVLIGRDPTPAMHRAAARDPMVQITGAVPDIGTHLRAAGILVAPIRAGAGTRIKILEAAALGVPVVATPLGAEGLGLEHGRSALIGRTSEELADHVVRLARDPELRQLITACAAEVADRHSPVVLERLIQEALAATVS